MYNMHYYKYMEQVPHRRYMHGTGSLKGGNKMAALFAKQYSKLEIFAKSLDNKDGWIKITDQKGKVRTEKSGSGFYQWIKLSLQRFETYEIMVSDCQISVSYLSGNDEIFEEGVCFLELGDEIKELHGEAFSGFYDTPYREQYHFNPYKNWINDPNGLCWFKGRYHLFYQANPHEQQWSDMYWGHAVSKDLIHWIHLPYVLEPQPCLLGDPLHKGGAFSGCAVPLEDEVVFYLTRHYGPQEDGPETLQWQEMMRSQDMLTLRDEKEIIREKPDLVGHDFRDPKVIKVLDTWYMVLGANLNKKSAILLYQSEDMKHWQYAGPLLTEPDEASTTFECPDFYMLDGTYVATAALMNYTDDCGRFQMTRCYIGTFCENRLKVEHTQWFDFGSNYYAVQSFEHEGRRIAIGWISDFYKEHRNVENGAYGSFAIPRELHIRDGRLITKPVKEIYQLLDKKLYSGTENVVLEKIPGNSYYVKLMLRGKSDFSLLLGLDGESQIRFEAVDQITQIKTVGGKTQEICFKTDVKTVREVEIFVDRRTVEVYINQGEAAGTKLFYSESKDGTFISKIDKIEELKQIEVYTMKSIW